MKKLLFLLCFLIPVSAQAQRFGSIRSGDDVSLSSNTILNRSTLQSGATFYVSSASVSGQFSPGSIKFLDGTVQVSSPDLSGFLTTSSATATYLQLSSVTANYLTKSSASATYFILPSLTNGSVLFSNGASISQDNSNFFWDDANNRLGIGTVIPASKLSINGGTSFANIGQLVENGAFSGIVFGSATASVSVSNYNLVGNHTGFYLSRVAGGDIHFREANGTDQMTIQNTTGNVGIGASSPLVPLDLGLATGAKLLLYGSGGTQGYLSGMGLNLGQTPNSMGFFIGKNANFSIDAANVDEPFPYASGYTTRLTILNSGNVGIGTVAPANKLHVSAGTIRLDYSYPLIARNFANSADISLISLVGNPGSIYVGDTNTEGGVFFHYKNGFAYRITNVTSGAILDIFEAANTIWNFRTGEASDIAFSPNFVTAMTVKNGGRVGIQTTAPGAMLEVDSVNASTIAVIVKGAISQSANLQQWQDGSSNVLVSISSGGIIASTERITSSRTTDLGWSVPVAANQACNTTCTSACVVGFDQGTLGAVLPSMVSCTDATADDCLCAGPN